MREDLSAYFDGELLPDDREALDSHLRDCADCLRELNTLKRVDDAYAKLASVKAPAGFEASVRETVKSGKSTTFQRRSIGPRWAGPLVAAAAAAIVMIGGVVLLEWQQGVRTELAMAPQEGLALRRTAEDSADFDSQSTPAGDAQGGNWDAFTANGSRAQASGNELESASTETRAGWEGFVRDSGPPGGAAPDADDKTELEATDAQEIGLGLGRADEVSSRPNEIAASPAPVPVTPKAETSVDEESDRSAVLGEPPSTLSAQRAEALKDAASQTARNESDAKAALERQTDAAQASGEVLERTTLRSFKVGADGIWYQVGYSGEATTSLARESDTLRELMKKHPEFDWNKMLDRSARQVFQLDGAWFALEAMPEQE